jgi:LmbE family N-acetylglucosaminyl deacetylase
VNVLAVGAHPDDIELGCAGTLARHVWAGDTVTMLVMTTGERGPQDSVPRVDEQVAAARLIGANLIWGGFSDGAVPTGGDTVAFIDEVVRLTRAEILYTHAPKDSHQDHVTTALCSLAAARRLPRVLCYQSPSTTSFDPNLFVDIDETFELKRRSLSAHQSQVLRCEMVDLEAVGAAARYWGHRSRVRHAEGFETPRFVWQIGADADVSRTAGRPVETADPQLEPAAVEEWAHLPQTRTPAPRSRDEAARLMAASE